jgi:asparagine synthase (glutamine-hydrolysing)
MSGGPAPGPPSSKPETVIGNPLGLDSLELATGLPLGVESATSRLPDAGEATPREVLEAGLIPALARPPCVVNFSGGRDSSAVLMLATSVARREGLPDPIALTWRFPAHPRTDESRWQEQVISSLGLREWEILNFNDELEVLGEMATGLLRQHGVLWPPVAHLNLPALTRARGGSFLFASDLENLLEGWAFARPSGLIRGRMRPERRDAGRVAVALLPRIARARLGRAELGSHFPWLTPEAQRLLFARKGGRHNMPRRWDRWLAWFASQRAAAIGARSLALLAREHDTVAHNPFRSPVLLAALAKEGGAWGVGGRAAITHRLFGDLVPASILERPHTRTEYGGVLWAGRSSAFAQSWDGSGVDHDLVDVARLREIWTGPRPWLYGWSAIVAQTAWLASLRPDRQQAG